MFEGGEYHTYQHAPDKVAGTIAWEVGSSRYCTGIQDFYRCIVRPSVCDGHRGTCFIEG